MVSFGSFVIAGGTSHGLDPVRTGGPVRRIGLVRRGRAAIAECFGTTWGTIIRPLVGVGGERSLPIGKRYQSGL